MRVLIIHLSDMHVAGRNDVLLARATRIADAVNSRSIDIDQSVMLVTGDIAFSGKAWEYDLASSFLRELKANLQHEPVVAIVPGNHDCDFTSDQAARDLLIEGLAKREPLESIEPSIIAQCTAVQDNFFAFRDSIAAAHILRANDRMSFEYAIQVAPAEIKILCFNTAWISKLHEVPGTLVYPTKINGPRSASFTIAAFHHPYHWLAPNGAKRFRRAIEDRADVILTGHEHDSDQSITSRPLANVSTAYIEGGALQESSVLTESAFNLLIVDTDASKQKFFQFKWNEDRYYPAIDNESWEPLTLDIGKSGQLDLQSAFRDWLDDPGLPNARRHGKQRSFSELFIYPDLIESVQSTDLNRARRIIKSVDVFASIEKLELTFASAPPKSGRTAIAKRLFIDFSDAGYVPIYINASDGTLRPDNAALSGILRNAEKQYGKESLEAYRQLGNDRRVIIVDNFDSLKLKTSAIVALISELRGTASRVVLLGDNTIGRMAELASIVDRADNKQSVFDVQPLNHALRERFAQRWFSTAGNLSDELDDAEQTKRLASIERTLDTIMGKNYVPAFPFYVISILQAFEDGASVDMRASTHGYFYELIIRLALTGGGSATKDVNVRLAFLTHLAFEMFELKSHEILGAELRESFDRYQTKHDVGGLDYDKLIDGLISRGLLVRDADQVRFRYPYLYFYFVALRLSNNLSHEPIREHIKYLASHLDNDDAPDILMFLAHLSADKFLIETLLNIGNDIYADTAESTLNAPVGKANEDAMRLSYTEANAMESRQRYAEIKDEQLASADATKRNVALVDGSDKVVDKAFASALETIKIMGQILKNFPGSLEAETKLSLALSCTRLGLRCLQTVLDQIEGTKETLVGSMVARLRQAHPNLPDDRLKSRADRALWLVRVLVGFGVVKSVSNAIAAPELEPTYNKVAASNDSMAMALIDASLRMEISSVFPTTLLGRVADRVAETPLPKIILSLMVLAHLQQMYVPRNDVQKILAKLGIAFKPQLFIAKKDG